MPPALAPQVLNNALDAVGNTPLIRLDKTASEEGLKCNLRTHPRSPRPLPFTHSTIVAKVEFFSAGGSVKDRIAKRMVEEAETEGKLIPGRSVVIEPTSGNTGAHTSWFRRSPSTHALHSGIGLAMACAVKV